VRDAENTVIENEKYLSLYGMDVGGEADVSSLWRHIFNELYSPEVVKKDPLLRCLEKMISQGTLSGRISKALPAEITKEDASVVYSELCNSLEEGKLFGINGQETHSNM